MPKKTAKMDAIKKDRQANSKKHTGFQKTRPKTNKGADRHRVYPGKHRKNALDRKAVGKALSSSRKKGAKYFASKMDKQDKKDLKKLASKRPVPSPVR